MRNLSEILTELDRKEYEEFCLHASYINWQDTEVYGEVSDENNMSKPELWL